MSDLGVEMNIFNSHRLVACFLTGFITFCSIASGSEAPSLYPRDHALFENALIFSPTVTQPERFCLSWICMGAIHSGENDDADSVAVTTLSCRNQLLEVLESGQPISVWYRDARYDVSQEAIARTPEPYEDSLFVVNLPEALHREAAKAKRLPDLYTRNAVITQPYSRDIQMIHALPDYLPRAEKGNDPEFVWAIPEDAPEGAPIMVRARYFVLKDSHSPKGYTAFYNPKNKRESDNYCYDYDWEDGKCTFCFTMGSGITYSGSCPERLGPNGYSKYIIDTPEDCLEITEESTECSTDYSSQCSGKHCVEECKQGIGRVVHCKKGSASSAASNTFVNFSLVLTLLSMSHY